MKSLQQTASKFWLFLWCILAISCSDSSELPDNPTTPIAPTPDPVMQNYHLKEGVNEIKDDNLSYIVEAINGETLVLSNSYPSNELPTVGEIVFVYPNAEKMPYGFLGKVSEIKQSGGNYNLITEEVDLDEAFSYLSVNETIDMEFYTENEEIADSRVAFETINGYKCALQPISGTYQIYDDALSLGAEGQITCGIRRSTSILINDTTNTNTSVVKFDYYIDMGGEVHFLAEIDDKDKFSKNKNQLMEIFNNPILKAKIPAGIASFFASPNVDVNFGLKLDAALSLGIGCSFSNESSLAVITENGVSRLVHEKYGNQEPMFTLLPNSEIALSGSIFLGPILKPTIRLFNRDNLKVNLECAVGPKIEGEISYDPINDKSLYNALKDDKISSALSLVAEAGGNFTRKYEWAVPLLDLDLFSFTENYIFPEFSDCKIKEIEENKYKMASTTLKRDLVFNTPVGIAAYDENDSILFKIDPVDYWLEKDFEDLNPIEMKYENVENADYSIWTYVKWGDTYVKCKRFESILGKWLRQDEDDYLPHYWIFEEDGRMGIGDGDEIDFDFNRKWELVDESTLLITFEDPDYGPGSWRYVIEELSSDVLVVGMYEEEDDGSMTYWTDTFHRVKE